MNIRSICVFGGGGFVGSHLVPMLAQRGYTVTVPVRRREAAKHLFIHPQVNVVQADIHAPGALDALCAGQDAVINLLGILHEGAAPTRRFDYVHGGLPGRIAQASQRQGVTRLLHMSALGADAASRSAYQRSKAAGEAAVLGCGQESGLDVTIFRPSVIFGPGDSFLGLFAELLGMAPVVPLAGGHARFQPVYVGDVARAFTESLVRRETIGKGYDLCGPRVYTLAELVRLTAAALGLRRWVLPLGETASYGFARLMELKPGRKLMTRDNHYAMQVDNVCADCETPFGAATSLESVIGYLREAGPRRSYTKFRRQAGR